jgi:hypothetical protein
MGLWPRCYLANTFARMEIFYRIRHRSNTDEFLGVKGNLQCVARNKLSLKKKITVTTMEWRKRHPVLIDNLPKNKFKLSIHFVKSRRKDNLKL